MESSALCVDVQTDNKPTVSEPGTADQPWQFLSRTFGVNSLWGSVSSLTFCWKISANMPVIDHTSLASNLVNWVLKKFHRFKTRMSYHWQGQGWMRYNDEWPSSKSPHITNAGEAVEKKEPSYTVGGKVHWCSQLWKTMEIPQKLKIELL